MALGGVVLVVMSRHTPPLAFASADSIRRARAIEEPLRWIAQNAGQEGSIVVSKVMELTGDHGFDADTEKYRDLVKAGVIDPTKVVRCALQNAGSIAGLMLTTEAMVTERPEQDTAKSTPRGRMPGMEDYH